MYQRECEKKNEKEKFGRPRDLTKDCNTNTRHKEKYIFLRMCSLMMNGKNDASLLVSHCNLKKNEQSYKMDMIQHF